MSLRSALLVFLALLTGCAPAALTERHTLSIVALQETGDVVAYHVSLTVSEINPDILASFASMIPERLDVDVDTSLPRNGTLTIDYDPQAERDGQAAYRLDDTPYRTISDARRHALEWLLVMYDLPGDRTSSERQLTASGLLGPVVKHHGGGYIVTHLS